MLTTLRPLLRCLGWFFVALLCVAVNGAVVFTNYLACKSSFELLGFEPKPLSADELWGPWIGLFAPNATICDFTAAAVAGTVFLGVFFAAHFGTAIFERWRDRVFYRTRGDEESANAALTLMMIDGVAMSILIVPLVLAGLWDVDLFRFRSIAGALGVDDPAVATRQIADWSTELATNGHLFAWTIAEFAPFGYLAVTALAALTLDFSFMKIGENWAAVWDTSEHGDADSFDDSDDGDNEPELGTDGDAPDVAQQQVEPDGAAPPPEPLFPGAPAAAHDATAEGATVPVIGRPGVTVTRAAAQADPRYHVDLETGEVWDREWWENSHAEDFEEAAK